MGDAMTRDSEVPVLIVGAGAAGLSTAAVLAQQGVKSWVVERRAAVYRYPKARNLSFRSLEILRRLGLRDAVHAVADDVSDMVVKPSLSSAVEAPALDLDSIFGGLADLSPEPPAQYCPQSRLEPMLADYVRGRGNDVSYSTELLSFSQDDTGVRAQLRDRQSGLISDVRARYLIAADGVHSPIRKSLAVSTSGHGALPIYVIFVYFKSPWRQLLSHLREGSAVQIINADVNGILVPADDDLAIFVTTYFPEHGDTAATFTEQHCRDLLLAAIGQPTSPLGNHTSWSLTVSAVAASFSSATVPTPCRRSRRAGRTSQFRAPTTWRGSWRRSSTGRPVTDCSTPTTPNGVRLECSAPISH
jgi:2-polyprenyl-6-methoxyphenol hydroxylase-like FAD-dependent oxidoreductase